MLKLVGKELAGEEAEIVNVTALLRSLLVKGRSKNEC